MDYISTRGTAPRLGFEDVLLTGLARDGGLYVPATCPEISAGQCQALQGAPYCEVAYAIMRPFLGGSLSDPELRDLIGQAYATFRHPAVAPLVQLDHDDWLMELFHGPTLAFKDVAMQVLARLMDRALVRRGRRAMIVGATSGDTGGAAIEAFRGSSAIDIVILHPHGRVSDVQRRQMTTPDEDNVHNIALEGTFDDCQALVKALFNDLSLRDSLGLAGVNSINWARVMAQIVYYFTSSLTLASASRPVSFSVPTGNFGDILAGHYAKRMGAPIDRLIIATNVNDILVRTLGDGVYSLRPVVATTSPSMDIQLSSNFERLAFELAGSDAGRVREQMNQLAGAGEFSLTQGELGQLRESFLAFRIAEAEAADTIRTLYESTGYLCDPHSAIGVAAARRAREEGLGGPIVSLATASPAKFPDAVKAASGQMPDMPAQISRQAQKEERYTVLPNDFDDVAQFVRARSRMGGGNGGRALL